MISIAASVGYNRDMPQDSKKKSETVLINLDPEMFALLESIRIREDRARGYVARELMIRGMSLYEIDGKLRGEAPAGTSVTSTTVDVGAKRKQLAPVVMKIEPGKAAAQRMIDEVELKPRKRRTG